MTVSTFAEKAESVLDQRTKELIEIFSEMPAVNENMPEKARFLSDMENPYDPEETYIRIVNPHQVVQLFENPGKEVSR